MCGDVIEKYVKEKNKSGFYYYFRCNKRKCRVRVPLRKQTIFDNAKIKLYQVYIMIYSFTQFLPYRKIVNEVSDFVDIEDPRFTLGLKM